MKTYIFAISAAVLSLILLVAGTASSNITPVAPKNAKSSPAMSITMTMSDTVAHPFYIATAAKGKKKVAPKYKFIFKDKEKRAAKWNRCAPITWKYNPKGQRRGGVADAKAAAKLLQQKSKFKFSYKGTTSAKPKKGDPKVADLVVGWAKPGDPIYGSKKSRTPAGVAAVQYKWAIQYDLATGKQTAGPPEIVWASVALNPKGISSRQLQKVVILHELSHVLGLGHVNSTKEIMNPVATSKTKFRLGAGDLTGLKKLGSGSCFNPSLR